MNKIIFYIFFFINFCSINAQTKAPNIIYILADDMGIGDVSAYNKSSKINTFHIDALAKQGIKFTDYHTSSSVCTPTRYGIMTGRYAWRTRLKSGVTHGFSSNLIETNRTTIASYLKTKGYNTAIIGKWHLGMNWSRKNDKKLNIKEGRNVDFDKKIKNGPNAFGFDYYYGISASLDMPPYAYIENNMIKGNLSYVKDKNVFKELNMKPVRPGWISDDFSQEAVLSNLKNKAISWITKQNKNTPNKPFFLYLPLTAPHAPIVPSDKFKGKSNLSNHGDFCLEIDALVGKISTTLDHLNITDNTLIVFTSDNGVSPNANLKAMENKKHYSSHIYRGLKVTLYEGGHRMPFILKWPKGITKQTTSDKLTCSTDFLATIMDLNNDKPEEHNAEDSVSFLSEFNGENKSDISRGAIVHHSDNGYFSIREGKWKLIFHSGAGSRRKDPKDLPVENPNKIQLFNLDKDVKEKTNIIALYPEKTAYLTGLMAKLINNGRSTDGIKQKTIPFKGEKQLLKLQAFKKYLSLE
jgi:arylsulfatase A